MELLFPDRVQVSIDGLGPLLGLAHLNGNVRIAGSSLVLCLKSLSADHCCHNGGEMHEEQSLAGVRTLFRRSQLSGGRDTRDGDLGRPL